MNKLLAFMASLGVLAANGAAQACLVIILDEPTMPKSLIK